MSNLSILLIDDDASINYLNKIVIEQAGIDADIIDYTEPQKALARLQSGELTPDIILLDVNMPLMDGWEFMSSLKQFPASFKAPKIILLTSSINPSDESRALSDTLIDAFHSKPLTIDLVKK